MLVPHPRVTAGQYELYASIYTSVSAWSIEPQRETLPYSDLAINILTEVVALEYVRKDSRRGWQ